MKIECKKKYKVDYSLVDKNTNLRITECFNLAQNNATEYFQKFNGDNIYVKENYNSVWVVSKSKIHVFKNSSWLDILEGDSYTSLVKPIRIETETKFKDKKGDLIFVANQESCLLDIDSRRIRKIDTINFPEDLEIDETLFERNYQRLNDTFDENDFVYEQKIYSQDIDFSKHVNNVIYVRFIMNSLSNDFLDNIDITDLEMHFIAESKEGQTLKIYKKELDNNVIRFLIKENDREIIRASIDYKNK